MDLLPKIREFLKRTKMSKTYFGTLSVGQPELVGRLERGGDVRMKTYVNVLKFIEEFDTEQHKKNRKKRTTKPADLSKSA